MKLLVAVIFSACCATVHEAQRESKPRLPMLTNEEAWKRLPGAPPEVQPLPSWARLWAGPLPMTTARMLELDALHRTGNRLDPRLRGLSRWAAADANGCDYARAVAAADLRRAGVQEAELKMLISDPSKLTPAERAATAFARKMMRQAYAVTDDEFKEVLDLLGEERTVALVALVAYASFQDRILLAVNAPLTPVDLGPPLVVQFEKPKPKTPPPGSAPTAKSPVPRGGVSGAIWNESRNQLDKQRARPGRIRVPTKEEVVKRLGENHPSLWQADILWSRVCYGNQPELTDAWFACSMAFGEESKQDRVFGQCIFWIVTQSLQCFY